MLHCCNKISPVGEIKLVDVLFETKLVDVLFETKLVDVLFVFSYKTNHNNQDIEIHLLRPKTR